MTVDSEAMSIRMLTTQLGEALVERQWQVVCAESCTGGGLAFELSAVPGCSRWFDRAFVAYSNDAKHETLGVSHRLMIEHGAVSSECVAAMTEGSLKRSSARFAMAASGVAGPGGGSEEKPVGTVWLAWQVGGRAALTQKVWFAGERDEIRAQTIRALVQGALEQVQVKVQS